MNLEKLFATQKILRDRIGYNEPDRFNKLILALLVELGELANEQRSWKYWSKDQTPRTRKSRAPYMDLDDADFYNPLLEEYVDGLHVVLDLGIEIDFEHDEWELKPETFGIEIDEVYLQFIFISENITDFRRSASEQDYVDLFEMFLGLGEMLGFTWKQIETAYFAKNAINHKRQEEGY
jgi:dimeric dUTPase (all-alpha-NTP-PPase superfamily)